MVCFSFLAGARSIVFVVIACLHFHCLSLVHLNFFRFAVFITLTVLFGLFQSSLSIHLVRVGSYAFLVFRIWVCTWTLAAAGFAVTIRHVRCIQATPSGLEAIRAGRLLFSAEIIGPCGATDSTPAKDLSSPGFKSWLRYRVKIPYMKQLKKVF